MAVSVLEASQARMTTQIPHPPRSNMCGESQLRTQQTKQSSVILTTSELY
jgi:hypothetical protein